MTDKRIEVISWSPVGIWTFNVSNTECQICRNMLTNKCASCLESKNVLQESCLISKGKCGHAFHFHCIQKSIKSGNPLCPNDAVVWNAETENLDAPCMKKVIKKKINHPQHIIQPSKTTTDVLPIVPSDISSNVISSNVFPKVPLKFISN